VVDEVDQVDHAPDRPVGEREHIASRDRCGRMSYPEIAAVGALQSDLCSHVHAASMPSAPAESDDPFVSYPAKTASTTLSEPASIERPLQALGAFAQPP
jgi:hypothetical protein